MTDVWIATIHVWPHTTGSGADVDQANAGAAVQSFEFIADGIDDALRLASSIVRGVETNPAVWKAPIVALVRGQ